MGIHRGTYTFGDIITGESTEPEVVVATSPSVGGLLDSLTGSIGISGTSATPKPAAAPAAASTVSGSAMSGASITDAPKIVFRPLDKDVLRSFISSAMPFGTPLDLNYTNISAIKTAGFSLADLPPADRKQPAWKPYLYRGKQRIPFTIHETVHASMYDRDEISDSMIISGQVNWRAELEGLPDVSFPLTGLDTSRIESLSFHHGAQVPEHGGDKQAVTFSPPLKNFTLVRYQAFCSFGPPIKGFYQLSMVSENEGAFLFKLSFMEGYKAPLTIEFCTVIMLFPKRKVVSFDGTPSIGTVSYTDHFVEWKLITNRLGVSGKIIEATFPGTFRFAPWQAQRPPSAGSAVGTMADEHGDFETESSSSNVNVEDYIMEKMSKDLQAVDLEEPFCWQAYNYAKVSFKIIGPSLSGMSIDSKSVSIFPTVKAPVECSTQVIRRWTLSLMGVPDNGLARGQILVVKYDNAWNKHPLQILVVKYDNAWNKHPLQKSIILCFSEKYCIIAYNSTFKPFLIIYGCIKLFLVIMFCGIHWENVPSQPYQ